MITWLYFNFFLAVESGCMSMNLTWSVLRLERGMGAGGRASGSAVPGASWMSSALGCTAMNSAVAPGPSPLTTSPHLGSGDDARYTWPTAVIPSPGGSCFGMGVVIESNTGAGASSSGDSGGSDLTRHLSDPRPPPGAPAAEDRATSIELPRHEAGPGHEIKSSSFISKYVSNLTRQSVSLSQ